MKALIEKIRKVLKRKDVKENKEDNNSIDPN
jgi:hypothetical protein